MSNELAISGTVPPLVTVAMPVYNAGKYLRLAVLSIIKQTYPHWELLLIDDGSTDNALESIADIQDERIHIYRDGKNKGLAARLNECIDQARGKYIARMDQDDVSYPERLAKQVKMLEESSLLDLIGVRAITISEQNKATGSLPWRVNYGALCAHPWRGFYLPHPTWMGKTTWFRKYRYANPGSYFCEDQELLLRSYQQSKFGIVNEVLFAYRIRGRTKWGKLLKTRLTVLRVYLNYFRLNKQPLFALMAVISFIGRLIKDVLTLLSIKKNTRTADLDEEIVQCWQKIFQSIQLY